MAGSRVAPEHGGEVSGREPGGGVEQSGRARVKKGVRGVHRLRIRPDELRQLGRPEGTVPGERRRGLCHRVEERGRAVLGGGEAPGGLSNRPRLEVARLRDRGGGHRVEEQRRALTGSRKRPRRLCDGLRLEVVRGEALHRRRRRERLVQLRMGGTHARLGEGVRERREFLWLELPDASARGRRDGFVEVGRRVLGLGKASGKSGSRAGQRLDLECIARSSKAEKAPREFEPRRLTRRPCWRGFADLGLAPARRRRARWRRRVPARCGQASRRPTPCSQGSER